MKRLFLFLFPAIALGGVYTNQNSNVTMKNFSGLHDAVDADTTLPAVEQMDQNGSSIVATFLSTNLTAAQQVTLTAIVTNYPPAVLKSQIYINSVGDTLLDLEQTWTNEFKELKDLIPIPISQPFLPGDFERASIFIARYMETNSFTQGQERKINRRKGNVSMIYLSIRGHHANSGHATAFHTGNVGIDSW